MMTLKTFLLVNFRRIKRAQNIIKSYVYLNLESKNNKEIKNSENFEQNENKHLEVLSYRD